MAENSPCKRPKRAQPKKLGRREIRACLQACLVLGLCGQAAAAQRGALPAAPADPAWQRAIDIVIPWSGPNHAGDADCDAALDKAKGLGKGLGCAARNRDNGELPYLLRSVALNAPWVRKIWLLVNEDQVEPKEGARKLEIPPVLLLRTAVVNRCVFMPAGTCPTRNSFAVSAFAHRIPGLSERFIWVEDDIFLGQAVPPTFFFSADGGKPFYWRKAPHHGFFRKQEFHRLYEDPTVVDFPTPKSSCPCPHYWWPQRTSVCASMEKRYPELYAFVGEHITSRYSSAAKGMSQAINSQEEEPGGWISWEYFRTGMGVFKDLEESVTGPWWGGRAKDKKRRRRWKNTGFWNEVHISKGGFELAARDPMVFINVNDRYSTDVAQYLLEVAWFHGAMEALFPKSAPELQVKHAPTVAAAAVAGSAGKHTGTLGAVYVMSLQDVQGADPRNAGRLDTFRQAWAEMCGTEVEIKACPGVLDTRRGHGNTRSWVGCFKQALDDGALHPLFFEDDARLFNAGFCAAKTWSDVPGDAFLIMLGGHKWEYGAKRVGPYRQVTKSLGTYGFMVPRRNVKVLMNGFQSDLALGNSWGDAARAGLPEPKRGSPLYQRFMDMRCGLKPPALCPDILLYAHAKTAKQHVYAIHPLVVLHQAGYSNTWKKQRGEIVAGGGPLPARSAYPTTSAKPRLLPPRVKLVKAAVLPQDDGRPPIWDTDLCMYMWLIVLAPLLWWFKAGVPSRTWLATVTATLLCLGLASTALALAFFRQPTPA